MRVILHNSFVKSYKKRILYSRSISAKTKLRTELFKANPNHPSLDNHQLTGSKKGLFSFSVTGDVRIITKYTNT